MRKNSTLLVVGALFCITLFGIYYSNIPERVQYKTVLDQPVHHFIEDIGVTISSEADLGLTSFTLTKEEQIIDDQKTIRKVVDIQPEQDENLNADFVFHYKEQDLNGLDESQLILYSSTDKGKTWEAHLNSVVDINTNTIRLEGVGHFSLWTAALMPAAPGGVSSDLQLWYKADVGTDVTTDGVDITTWDNSAPLSYTLEDNTTGTAATPDHSYDAIAFNYNPGVDAGRSMFNSTSIDLQTVTVVISDQSPGGTNDGVFSELGSANNRLFTSNTNPTTWLAPGSTGFDFGTGGTAYEKGVNVTNPNTTTDITILTVESPSMKTLSNGFELGYDLGGQFFQGKIMELVGYRDALSSTERQRAESYLALKYGITLDQTTATDYLASDGITKMWDGTVNSTYNNDIAGIGRDDNSALDQRISKSENSDALVAFALDNDFTAANNDVARTTVHAADLSFMTWGNNDATNSALAWTTTGAPTANRQILNRVWRIDEVGTVGTVHLSVPDNSSSEITELPEEFGQVLLLTKTTDADFSTGADQIGLTLNGNYWELPAGIDLADGTYFTFATYINAPGGIATNLTLWLKADADVTGGATVTQWNDQSGYSNNASSFTGNPNSTVSAANFNPTLTFSSDQMNADAMTDFGLNGDYEIFAVGSTNSTSLQELLGTDEDEHVFVVNSSSGFEHATDNASSTIGASGAFADGTSYLFGGRITSSSLISRVNGLDGSSDAANPVSLISQIPIGVSGGQSNYWDGDISEIVVYSEDASTVERQQIESYLSLKYGITIDQTTPTNYLSSDGTKIWDATLNSAYSNDITGIGRDDISVLNQKQSKSVNTDAIVTVGLNDISTTNPANTATFTSDLSFTIWGNNDGTATWTTTGAPINFEVLSRQWRIQETGAIGALKIQFDVEDLDFDVPALLGGTVYYLIYDSNDNDNLSDETPIALTNSSGDIWETSANINFGDGMEFTLATTTLSVVIDSDGDGIIDSSDLDDDNDGIADTSETGDTDGDGIPDSLESNVLDTDGDGTADYADDNADDEGATDGTGGEQDGVLSGPWNDTDNDGIPDHLDAANGSGTGTDIAGTGDSDGDGLSDAAECPGGFICPDSDGDNIPDYMDDTFDAIPCPPYLGYIPFDGYKFELNDAVTNAVIDNSITGVDLFFTLDGMTCFVLGYPGSATEGVINEYTAGTAYDPTTLTLSVSEELNTGFSRATAFTFSKDGMRLYIVEDDTDSIVTYDLSTAFDISTGVQNPAMSYALSANIPEPAALELSVDGLSMWILNRVDSPLDPGITQRGRIFPFDLSTAFNPATAVEGTSVEPVSVPSNNGHDLFWNFDGTTLFTYSRSGGSRFGNVLLSTPYDVSTFVSFEEINNSPVVDGLTSGNAIAGFGITPDGDKLYGVSNGAIGIFDMRDPLGFEEVTANDGSIDNSKPMTIYLFGDEQFTNPSGTFVHTTDYTITNLPSDLTPNLVVAADGKSAELTLLGNANQHLDENDLANLQFQFANSAFVGGDASTVLFSGSSTPKSTVGINFNGVRVLTYTLPTTLSSESVNIDQYDYSGDLISTATSIEVAAFSPTFNVLYLTDDTEETIQLYSNGGSNNISSISLSLTNAYDLKTDIPTADGLIDFRLNNDGTKFFTVDGSAPNTIQQFSLPSPYLINIVTYDGAGEAFTSTEVSSINAFAFNDDGLKLYLADNTTVYEYNLSVAHDISTASYAGAVENLSLTGATSQASFIEFSSTGDALYVGDLSTSSVQTFDLSSSYDISTGSLGTPLITGMPTSGIHDIAFPPNGTSQYVMGVDEVIYEYDNALVYPEASTNDGSIDNSDPITIKINSDGLFEDGDGNDELEIGTQLVVGNVPAGLTPVATLTLLDSLVTITFSSNATDHENLNDVEDLTFQFLDAAFVQGNASTVTNSGSTTPFSTNVGIDFQDTDDADGDGVPNDVEVAEGTDPNDNTDFVDSDGDGTSDYEGVTDPTTGFANGSDSDGDGVADNVESPSDPSLRRCRRRWHPSLLG